MKAANNYQSLDLKTAGSMSTTTVGCVAGKRFRCGAHVSCKHALRVVNRVRRLPVESVAHWRAANYLGGRVEFPPGFNRVSTRSQYSYTVFSRVKIQ
jgi:hypothetical protein